MTAADEAETPTVQPVGKIGYHWMLVNQAGNPTIVVQCPEIRRHQDRDTAVRLRLGQPCANLELVGRPCRLACSARPIARISATTVGSRILRATSAPCRARSPGARTAPRVTRAATGSCATRPTAGRA